MATNKKLPREVRWKINSLAYKNTKLLPNHQVEYERLKKALIEQYKRLVSEGVLRGRVMSPAEKSNQQLIDKLDEVMRKLQNTY